MGSESRSVASHRSIVVRPVAQFALAGLIAATILGVALTIASRRVGEREAIVDARTQALVSAQSYVEPVLTSGLARHDGTSVANVDSAVRNHVLSGTLVRVKIWDRSGRILYSDVPQLIGASYVLGRDELAAIDRGLIVADVSDLSQPENRYERSEGKLLEVYLPVRVPGTTTRLLFEAYFRYSSVAASGSRIWRSFAPISIGALVALELVQIPLAYSLARRLRDRQRERERLLREALDASDVERRRIAADLHDGVVQDLAGVAFTLGGAARQPEISPASVAVLDRAAGDVRDSVKSLRSLLVEIYPPNLFEEGLETALGDLVASTAARGVDARLDAGGVDGSLPPPVSALLYRTAQEALRNVVTHARATSVTVTVTQDAQHATLDVVDDGIGFDPSTIERAARSGHFGLDALTNLVASANGRLVVTSAEGRGTRVHAEVPIS